jgi:ATP-dependent NAD(P)H-hydrate dehydratase
VAVIGGSEDYTGAPYFSGMASAKLGADMSHVICEPGAGAVIKTYSPNLMVHPYMRQSKNMKEGENIDDISKTVTDMLSRLHVVVIGPGLGRDEAMQETCARVITEARKQGIPFIVDADGLFIIQNRPELVEGCTECILTPNIVEFGRLAKAKGIDSKGDPSKLCEELAKAFGGPTIIQKGAKDYISNAQEVKATPSPVPSPLSSPTERPTTKSSGTTRTTFPSPRLWLWLPLVAVPSPESALVSHTRRRVVRCRLAT